MDDTTRSITREDYTVGWICALPTESVAAQAMLDERHEALPNLQHDYNTYTLGRIAKHNVAIACLPKNQVGTTSAATVATTMRISFPSIRFGLMVGIGGGVPSKKNDIRLGDIVISTPTGTKTGVVQYDFGKTEKEGEFRRTGALGKPPAELLGAVAHLETKYGLEQQLSEHMSNGFGKWFPNWATRYAYQGADCDRLFEASYDHLDSDDEDCQQCSESKVANRSPREDSLPIVHYGNIASGNQVMKHGLSRDRLSKKEDIICFEMEAAGLMDNFQCLVIRGICDYADSHKNKRWQPYAAATAAAYAKEILATVAPRVVQGMAPIWNNRHWLVPRPVNPLFTGQTRLLKMLREIICDNVRQEVHDKQLRFVIIGIGGAGKSEVCLKFAEENRERFWAIFWIDASSEASLERNFIDIAIECGLQERSLSTGKRWLENTEHTWLLIMDNADDRKIDYTRYLPSGNRGNILMTTRNPECSIHHSVGQEFLDKLDVDDAESLLLKASGIDESLWDVRKPAAAKIVQLLGRHALAITQAGAFIRKGICALEEYPHEFQHQRQRLLRFCPDQSRSTYGGVYTTFEASARVLEKSSDPQAIDALELLRTLAFVHFDRVPILMFQKAWIYAQMIRFNEENGSQESITTLSDWHVSRLPRFMRSLNSGELDIISLREAVRTLASFSIISINEIDDISMHPLVHVWAKDRLNQSDQTTAWISTASVLALSTERYGSDQQFWRRLRCHVEICVDLRSDDCFDENHFEIARTFYSLGWFLYIMRSTFRAHDLLTITLKKLKDNHASSPEMRVQHLLAMCYSDLEQHQTAIELLGEVVSIERAIDPEHPDCLASEHELASAYIKSGQHERATELLEEVVRIEKATLNPEHPYRLSSEHQLAMVYMKNGQYKKAKELLEEVVRIWKLTLDPEYPDRLTSEHMLARVHMEIGQLKRATELLEEVVKIRKVTLDPEHPDRLGSEHALARVYMKNGQLKRATELLEEVARIRKVTLDPQHPHRLGSEHELARSYMKNEQYTRAAELLEEVVRVQKVTLDSKHPFRLESEAMLANAYSCLGQLRSDSDKISNPKRLHKL